MAKLKALVIGVNEYIHGRKGQCLEDTNMPSAAKDAERVKQKLTELAPKLGFSEAHGRVLVGRDLTRRDVILQGLKELADKAEDGDLMVLYFSGHSAWTQNIHQPAGGKPKSWYEVVLCPSDTDWKRVVVRASDVGKQLGEALARTACLEIILETCSATGLPDDGIARAGFGDGRGDGVAAVGGIRAPFVRWDASALDESSHSGVYPACDEDQPLQGLFTRLFCDSLVNEEGRQRKRIEVLKEIDGGLQFYRRRHLTCCGKDPFLNIPGKHAGQTPKLRCAIKAEDMPALMANCSGALRARPAPLRGSFNWKAGAP